MGVVTFRVVPRIVFDVIRQDIRPEGTHMIRVSSSETHESASTIAESLADLEADDPIERTDEITPVMYEERH